MEKQKRKVSAVISEPGLDSVPPAGIVPTDKDSIMS